MAIDTANKRASAIGVGSPFRVLPTPSGSIGAEDRLHLAFLYRGIAAANPNTAVFDEEAIESSLLYWFEDNVVGVSSINYDEEPFDLESATEAVEVDVLFTDQWPRRSADSFRIGVEVTCYCWAKFGSNRYRAEELVDAVVAAFGQRGIPVYDYDLLAEPRVGNVSLFEPQIRNLTREHNEANFTAGSLYQVVIEGMAEPC